MHKHMTLIEITVELRDDEKPTFKTFIGPHLNSKGNDRPSFLSSHEAKQKKKTLSANFL